MISHAVFGFGSDGWFSATAVGELSGGFADLSSGKKGRKSLHKRSRIENQTNQAP
jgi:hypothetical protein